MHLTDPEKFILMMLSDIHKHLQITNGINAGCVQSAILTGNTWGLYFNYDFYFEKKGETPASVLGGLKSWRCGKSHRVFVRQAFRRRQAAGKSRWECFCKRSTVSRF